MSSRIPQVDGGGYEKDDDYNAPDEESESSSSPSEISDEDEGSGSDSEEGSERHSLRRRTVPKTEDIQEGSQPKRSTRQSKRKVETLTKGKKSGENSGRKSGGRRSSVKAQDYKTDIGNSTNDMEAEDGNFFCANCKKQFGTKVALNNHAYWCASKRITRSRGTTGQPAGRPGPSQKKKTKEPKKRGRKPAASKQPVINDLVVESEDVIDTQEEEEEVEDEESYSLDPNVGHPEEWAESTEESDYEAKINSDSQPLCEPEANNTETFEDTENFEDDEESEVPVTCSNCKMTYRNVASLQKHFSSCVYVSSSASEDENQDEASQEDEYAEAGNQQFAQRFDEEMIEMNDETNSVLVDEISEFNTGSVINMGQPPSMQLGNSVSQLQEASIHSYNQQSYLQPNSSYSNIPGQYANVAASSESQITRITHESRLGAHQILQSGNFSQPSPSSLQQLSSSSSTENGLLKQVLSSSMNSSNPTTLNQQYQFSAQSNINPGMATTRTPETSSQFNTNGGTQYSSTHFSSYPPVPSSQQYVPQVIRNDSPIFANSIASERFKSNNLEPGGGQVNAMVPNSSTSVQHQVVANTNIRSNVPPEAITCNMNMHPGQYAHYNKALQIQNTSNHQPFMQQTPEYLSPSRNMNPSAGQNNMLRFNAPDSGSLLSQQQVDVCNTKPQQPQPATQAYQTVTFQGENGQLYRVNIPVPQGPILPSVEGPRNQICSTQQNYATNTCPQPQLPQQSAHQGYVSNIEDFQNIRRLAQNSDAGYIQAQHQHMNASQGNLQLASQTPVPNSITSDRQRHEMTSNASFSEYANSMQSTNMQQQGSYNPTQIHNTMQCQVGQNSPQIANILQQFQKVQGSQVGPPILSGQGMKQHGEQQALTPSQLLPGYGTTMNHTSAQSSLTSLQSQQQAHAVEQQQAMMYQNELLRHQLLHQHQQSEQLQKHYQNLQSNGSPTPLKPEGVLSNGMAPQGHGSPQMASSQMSGTNLYSSNSGLGQAYQTQLNQNYLMQNTSNPNHPSLMPFLPKSQPNQGPAMSTPQDAFNRLSTLQSHHFPTTPTLSYNPRPLQPHSGDDNSLQRSDQLANPPQPQSIKPGTSTASMTPTNVGQTQMNIPYQIVQGADGTTYIIVQSSPSMNVQSNTHLPGPPTATGLLNPHISQNISEIVQSALIAQQANGSMTINGGIQPGSSFNVSTTCTANTSLTQLCTCQKCILLRSSTVGSEKYRKVLPSPRPIEPKVTPSEGQVATTSAENPAVPYFVKTYQRKHTGSKAVKTQLANMLMEKQGTSSSNGQNPDSNIILNQMTEDMSTNPETGALRKNPVLTAVVRPMEHPLQKMSDQISQIESIFSATPALGPARPLDNPGFVGENVRKDSPGISQTPQNSGTQMSQGNNSNVRPPGHPSEESPAIPRTQASNAVKRKGEPLPTSPAKSIKVTLKRKERGDSYCINDVSETGASSGPMRSIKIKAKITTGELAGTSTDVVVEPKIHIVPIPDPDADDLDSNLTIAENDSPIVGPILAAPPPANEDAEPNGAKLTHRAVVVYEVKCNNKIQYRSSNVRAIWSYVFGAVQWARLSHNLPPISYPATNISLENKGTPTTNFNVGGLIHRAVQFLIQYLPKESSASDKQQFPFHEPATLPNDDNVEVNETGCARTEGFVGRKPFDMFGWLASKHRKPLEKIATSDEPWKNNGLPIAVRFRTMKEKTRNTLTVMWSIIHGRGLYTRRSIEKSEMIIEYAGEVIRSLVCDQREKYYETKSIGCYMFRIDDEYVIDATMKGNAARFINHSCEPNCESKSMKILGKDRIMIFALRKISSGEELTYDYKFEKEDVKIPCSCGSTKCRKYLN